MLAVTPAEAAGRSRLQPGESILPARAAAALSRASARTGISARAQRTRRIEMISRMSIFITHESAREVHAFRPFSSDLLSSGAGVTIGRERDATGGRMEPGLAVDGVTGDVDVTLRQAQAGPAMARPR